MTSLTASSLSHETARLDRAAAERTRPPADGGGAQGGEGFAGLLRAAGVQAQAAPLAAQREGAARPELAAQSAHAARAARAGTTVDTGGPRSGAPGAAEGLRAESARADRGRDRTTADADVNNAAVSAADGAGADTDTDTDTDTGAAAASDGAAAGTATLAHGVPPTPAQRAALAAKGGARAAGRDGAGGACATGRVAAADTGDAAGLTRSGAASEGATLPGWASRDPGSGWVMGRWAGGADSAQAGAAAPAGAVGTEGRAGAVALDTAAPTADATPPALPAPGAEATQGFAGQLAALMGGAAAGSASATPIAAGVQVEVRTPVGAPGFGDEVMVKVAALSQDGVQEARLHLNPAELGPIQVRIAIEGGQARIDFGASADATRQLLESALPALAQALQADGLQLSASSVGELAPTAVPESAAASPSDAQGDLAGQAGGQTSGRHGGGWGQQNEAGAGASAAARLPTGTATAAAGRPGDALRSWAGPTAPLPGASLRGLDLYA